MDPAVSRYVAACAVYFAYALGMVCIDIYGFFDGKLSSASQQFSDGSSYSMYDKDSKINAMYIGEWAGRSDDRGYGMIGWFAGGTRNGRCS